MQMTGHKTRVIFECYNITSPNDLREAAQRLGRFGLSATSQPRRRVSRRQPLSAEGPTGGAYDCEFCSSFCEIRVLGGS
jgi:hypothetical protein